MTAPTKCGQCGKGFAAKACGPTHAMLHAEQIILKRAGKEAVGAAFVTQQRLNRRRGRVLKGAIMRASDYEEDTTLLRHGELLDEITVAVVRAVWHVTDVRNALHQARKAALTVCGRYRR